MLTYLDVRDFTIVDHLSLDVQRNMTAITGETGAGKSIMFDALSLCLGSRSDSASVRSGASKCDISASFDISKNKQALQWLEQHELLSGNECILRRTVNSDGRSKSFINGKPSPLQLTKELASFLVNIHGQHEHQALLKRDAQRLMLDEFANHGKIVDAVKQAFIAWRDIKNELHDLMQKENNPAERELIAYQVEELQALAIEENEVEGLSAELKQLANADDILLHCQRAIEALANTDGSDVQAGLQTAMASLQVIAGNEPSLQNCLQLLEQASIQVEEAIPELQSHIDNFNSDPERLSQVEQRLAKLHDVARKHHVKAEQLLEVQAQLEHNLSLIENSETHMKDLQKALAATEDDYHNQADRLSQSRRKAASKLAKQVSQYMQDLGLQGGKFTITFNTLKDETPRINGSETVEYMVSTNPGQPLRALNKVASGGELSRIALAIQVITASQEGLPCLLFDEVDVGIGGATAHTVGKLLRQLGCKAQVICVTHLAQVAAYAHHHLLVEKTRGSDSTSSQIVLLEQQPRVDELARMMGAKTITKQSQKHAQELLASVE